MSRLSSPDELDTLLHITTPRTWLALITVGFCIFVALVWGIYGQISYKLSGAGMLMTLKGLFTISSPGMGELSQVKANLGKTVQKGEIVAIIIHPDEETEVQAAKEKLEDLRSQYTRLEAEETENLQKKTTTFASRKKEITLSIQTSQSKLNRLEQRINEQQVLLEKGLITRHSMSATMEERDDTRVQILKFKNELKQLNLETYQAGIQKDNKLKALDSQIQEADRTLRIKYSSLKEITDVVSPYSGVVVELPIRKGDRVSVNQVLMTLQPLDKNPPELVVVQYYPAISAPKIAQGMTMQVAPGIVKADKFGYALAAVNSVAEFPATDAQLLEDLRNKELVKEILSHGAVLEVRASLKKDRSTISGYQWTSSKGPPIKLGTGLECTSSVIVESVPPITLVIPMLRKYFLGIGNS